MALLILPKRSQSSSSFRTSRDPARTDPADRGPALGRSGDRPSSLVSLTSAAINRVFGKLGHFSPIGRRRPGGSPHQFTPFRPHFDPDLARFGPSFDHFRPILGLVQNRPDTAGEFRSGRPGRYTGGTYTI